ncbi:hypothetical protein [Mucilaginibacter dorajii]|uniref:Lipoprotein n=1 Tax=Mucilaginibacter dorajii TaxID=692994 RepID=A0ABP7R6U1_9SPHI|nr:hypothetical protein [Mucilaginibacter dorajii]MCS3737449.1 hypothetical protein [Mucilaginibacter dorajii]
MKKSLFKFFIISLVAASICGCKSNRGKSEMKKSDSVKSDTGNKETLLQDLTPFRYSLSGYSYEKTNQMVQDFKDDPGVLDTKTSSWFTKAFIDSLNVLLHNEPADGVRIYLARKADGVNTFIWVTTVDDGPNPEDTTKEIHLDYFKHSSSFLKTAIVNAKDENGSDKGGALLFYANPCIKANCTLQAEHQVDCAVAKEWATAYTKPDYNTIDIETKSEWFSKGFIDYLDRELNAAPKDYNVTGIRIYLGFQPADSKHKDDTHNFIITTTKDPQNKNINTDYYECFLTKGLTDNGEQCPNNCKGATLPQP